MSDVGITTRVGGAVRSPSPKIAASGPSPGIPTTAHGVYGLYGIKWATADEPIQRRTTQYTPRVVRFKMRGMDKTINGLYDTWIVSDAADYAAAQYTGALATPLRDVIVAAFWST